MAKTSKHLRPERKIVPVDVVMRHQSFDDEIEAVRRYIGTVISSFHREIERYKQYLLKRADGAQEDEIQWLAEDLGDAEHYYVDHFPAFALQTTFVATYTLLEAEILNLARLVGEKLGDLKDPEGSEKGIFAAKSFIERHALAFPTGHVWDEARAYWAIRNAVAHCRCNLKHARRARDIRKYVLNNPTLLTIDKTDHLRMTDDFCMHVLDNVQSLMRELFVTVRRRFASRIK